MKKKNKDRNLLELIPVRLCESEQDGTNEVVLVPKFTGRLTAKLLMPRLKNPYARIHLDEMGSSIWRTIDNKKNVFEIGEIVKERHGETIEPLYERLGMFLSMMKNHNMIRLEEKK